jgi:two-component system, cell cycle response regulator DivK
MQKILIVEDNFDNMNLVRLLLEREGYQVLQANDGLEGLDVARNNCPDLIALDLDMPVMDGWEFIHQAKADLALQSIPIVVVTAHLLPGDRNRVIEAGCSGYVSKPFKVKDLIGEIQRYLSN